MRRKYPVLIILLGLILVGAFAGFAVWQSLESAPTFASSGYILQTVKEEAQTLSFRQGERYSVTISGDVSFTSVEQGKVTVPKERFAHLDSGGTMALSDGVLLDMNDLSENFINNYYIPQGMVISGGEGTFSAQTTAGEIQFGEHVWKLADNMYIIRSSSLSVHFSASESYSAGSYVQIYMTQDNVAYIQAADGHWMTISPDCYIKTAKGVKIYPVSLLVDSGTYKMSLSKLTVGADDAIVLSELETRRQIVPELNIEAIDGEDGSDGISGDAGAEGQAGKGGEGGKNGGRGSDGPNANSESTTNSALPTMTISSWNLSGNLLQAAISVKDEAGFLSLIADMGADYNSKYPGTVTITNVSTGEVIYCEQYYSDGFATADKGSTQFDFTEETDTFYFSSPIPNPNDPTAKSLKPDTEYNLSVVAYYRTANPDMIYSREFINRNFTTASVGAGLAYVKATVNSVTISATATTDLDEATVYLLTPEQNKTFTTASTGNTANYVARWNLKSAQDSQKIPAGTYEHEFTGLNPNRSYVVRVVAENSGLEALAKQELNVKTLKELPTWSGIPTASYSRTNGVFLVSRPAVTDPQKGAVRYTYTPYTYITKDDGTKEKVALENYARVVTADTADPQEFHLSTGDAYSFEVKMEFFDNEKTTFFNLGESTEVQALGHTMPSVTLTGLSTYNTFAGDIQIKLHDDTLLVLDGNTSLSLEFYSSGILKETVNLTTNKKTAQLSSGHLGTVTLKDSTVPGFQSVGLSLKNLKGDKSDMINYSITITGTVDLHDGQGPVRLVLGTVSFSTLKALSLSADWDVDTNNTTNAFGVTLKLMVVEPSNTTATESQIPHTLEELKKGHVIVTLFSGSGSQKQPLGTCSLTGDRLWKEEDGSGALGTGFYLTDGLFNVPDLKGGADYTLEVTYASDATGPLRKAHSIGHENTFTPVHGGSTLVSSNATPPNLLSDPWNGVNAVPIRISDVGPYGLSDYYSPLLPEDTIVGYSIQANYDNSQEGLTDTITYYAFEYKTYATMVANGADPINSTTDKLMEVTLGMKTSTNVPKVAMFFGSPPAASGWEGQTKNGHYMTWPNKNPNGQEGTLSRGYRYIFAYTTVFSQNKKYPYNHGQYDVYKNLYGGLNVYDENGDPLGKNTVYVLHSGVKEAPWVAPSFYTYVQNNTYSNNSKGYEMILRYTWMDPEEDLIKTEGADITRIVLSPTGDMSSGYKFGDDNASSGYQDLGGGELPTWHALRIPYNNSDAGNVFSLYAGVSLFDTKMRYSEPIVYAEGKKSVTLYPDDADRMLMTRIPTQRASTAPDPTFWLDTSTYPYYLRVRFDHKSLTEQVKNVAAARVTIHEYDETKKPDELVKKVFTLPLTLEAGVPYVKLPMSMLSDFNNKSMKVTAVELFYDTGMQGWQYAEDADDYFVIQEYTADNEGLGSYLSSKYASTDSPRVLANGALLRESADFDADILATLLTGEDNQRVPQGSKLDYHAVNALTTNINNVWRFLFPSRLGMLLTADEDMELLNGSSGVPKQVLSAPLKENDSNAPYKIEGAPLSMSEPKFLRASNALTLTAYTISGVDRTNPEEIFVRCYSTEEDAKGLTESNIVKEEQVSLEADGAGPEITFSNLTKDTAYHFAFYYKNPKQDNAKTLLVRQENEDLRSVYVNIRTVEGAGVKANPVDYTKNYTDVNYFEKKLKLEFTLSNSYKVKLRYDILDTDGNVVLKYEDMVLTDYNQDPVVANPYGILSVPNPANLTTGSITPNTVTLDLSPLGPGGEPSELRDKLRPGGKYVMKFTALEGDTGKETGYDTVEFTIPAIQYRSARIDVEDVKPFTHADKTTKSPHIIYKVSINDQQHSMMGAYHDNSKSWGGLYAVRFVDEDDKWIRTIYDDQVFSTLSMDNLEKKFDLCYENLLLKNDQALEFDKAYTMQVYAVVDRYHNGKITLTDGTYDWSEFFRYHPLDENATEEEKQAARHTWGVWEDSEAVKKGLIGRLDSYWQDFSTGYAAKKDANTVKDRGNLLIGEKTQQTGSEGGYLVKEDGVVATKQTGKFRFIFYESYNLLDEQGKCVFEKVELGITGPSSGTGLPEMKVVEMDEFDTLIQRDEGIKAYYLDVPVSVVSCLYYDLELRLYEDLTKEPIKISMRIVP